MNAKLLPKTAYSKAIKEINHILLKFRKIVLIKLTLDWLEHKQNGKQYYRKHHLSQLFRPPVVVNILLIINTLPYSNEEFKIVWKLEAKIENIRVHFDSSLLALRLTKAQRLA